MTEDNRKPTWRFRLWWLRHRRHLLLREPYGRVYCAKCIVPAPDPFKKENPS